MKAALILMILLGCCAFALAGGPKATPDLFAYLQARHSQDYDYDIHPISAGGLLPGIASGAKMKYKAIVFVVILSSLSALSTHCRAARYTGQITGIARPSGRLIEAELSLYDSNGPGSFQVYASTKVDAHGHFKFSNLPDGRYQLELSGEHLAPRLIQEINVKESTVNLGVITLERGAQIIIKVRPSGDYTRVYANGPDGHVEADFDGKGNYVLDNLKGGSYDVEILHDGWVTRRVQVSVKLGGRSEPPEITLVKCGRISGAVKFADGGPNLNVAITATRVGNSRYTLYLQ